MKPSYTILPDPGVDGIVEMVRGGVHCFLEGRPTHWHTEWQLVAVTRGDGWVKIRGTKHRTPAGSLFFIPPEVAHSNGVHEEGCDWRSMLLSPQVVEDIAAAVDLPLDTSRITHQPVIICDELTKRFGHFHQCLEQPQSDLELEEELGAWICGLLERQTERQSAALPTVIHPAARRARECLWARADENITLSELARESGLSRFELVRQFKAAYGMPPHAWQLQTRIQRSKELLKAGLPAKEVAVQLGFADQAHFSRIFRRATGYTPISFAEKFRNIIQDRRTHSCEPAA